MRKFFLYLILFFLLPITKSYACTPENEIPCKSLDVVAQMMQNRFWSQITEFQGKWFDLYYKYIPGSANHKGVHFNYSKGSICKNSDYVSQKVAGIELMFTIQTPRHQEYKIIHSACENEVFLIERWVIKGSKLAPIDWKDIVLNKKRKFSLNENEVYKEVVFEAPPAVFVKNENSFFYFSPTRVPYLARSLYEKKNSNESVGGAIVISTLGLFGKEIFKQTRDFFHQRANFLFYTPSLFFRRRDPRFFLAECYGSSVDYFFNKDHRAIHSTGSSRPLGLSLLDFNKCLEQEVFNYFSLSKEMLQAYYDQFRPQFEVGTGSERSVILKNELKLAISFVQSGSTAFAEGLLRLILENVENETITDKRVE